MSLQTGSLSEVKTYFVKRGSGFHMAKGYDLGVLSMTYTFIWISDASTRQTMRSIVVHTHTSYHKSCACILSLLADNSVSRSEGHLKKNNLSDLTINRSPCLQGLMNVTGLTLPLTYVRS